MSTPVKTFPCGKQKYEYKGEAARLLARLKRQGNYREGKVYWCVECLSFHVGRTHKRSRNLSSNSEKRH